MGKDQDLIDASRSGQLAIVERILNNRTKKLGPLSSLRRGPGPNTTDSSGYTCLHHAALNGHKDIVSLLLTHDANPNIVDNKGSSALHLAAWTGDYEIVLMLITQSSHVPNVNLRNNDLDTALHCAAQYGHTSVVSLLLQHGADPTARNVRDESSLDLASQYGRSDTVEVLLRTRPSLVRNVISKHSPLHLASRNGHKNVVKMLIDAQFNINHCTDTGSALHEAALFGKPEVVKLLLNAGIDIDLEDCHRRTVMDLLTDVNTTIAKTTKKLIRDHSTLINTDDSSTLMSDSSSHCISPPPGYTDNTPEHHYHGMVNLDMERVTSPGITSASDFSFYEPPSSTQLSMTGNKRSSGSGDDHDQKTKTRLSRSRDSMLDEYSTCSSRSPSFLDYECTIPPPLPPKDFLQRESAYESVPVSVNGDNYGSIRRNGNYDEHTLMRPDSQASTGTWSSKSGPKPVPPVKPPRKSLSPVNKTFSRSSYGHSFDFDDNDDNDSTLKRNCDMRSSFGQSVTGGNSQPSAFSTFKSDHSSAQKMLIDSDFCALYDQIASNGTHGNCHNSLTRPSARASRAPRLATHVRSKSEHHQTKFFSDGLQSFSIPQKTTDVLKNCKRATVQIPLSPTTFDPTNNTTPEYEPPSPETAKNGINAVIKPLCEQLNSDDECIGSSDSIYSSSCCTSLSNCSFDDVFYSEPSVQYKRLSQRRERSKDIGTLTDDLFSALDGDGYVHLSLRHNSDNRQIITRSVSVGTDNFFANNTHASVNNIINNNYRNFCETLKLDRSGEKDNPFAGLCRGSVSSSKHFHHHRREITDGKKSLRRQKHHVSGTDTYTSTLRRQRKAKSMDETSKSKSKTLKNNHHISCSTVEDNNKPSVSVAEDSSVKLLSGSPFDENAEWAEIANIMASFGSGIGRESVFAKDLESQFSNHLSEDSNKSDDNSVEDWLLTMGLSEYTNLLIANGFDNLTFMGSNVMEDSDLLEIGVTNAAHRDVIISASKLLPIVKVLSKDEHQKLTVDEWLRTIQLSQYCDTFRINGFTDMHRVANLWEVELNTVLEIGKLGHRKRILASLGDRLKLVEDLAFDDLDFDKLNLNISELSVDDAPVMVRNESFVPKDDCESLPQKPLTQWKHSNSKVMASECQYTAKYLGSTLVRQLQGMESTRASIQKLKTSTKNIAKIPEIVLLISHTGVKFIDAHTQKLVCEHEVRNIHCACQDTEDYNHFAYITKEHDTNNHYCHVFSAQNTEIATEVILTLGQAFEIAYQMALESDNKKDNAMTSSTNTNSKSNTAQETRDTKTTVTCVKEVDNKEKININKMPSKGEHHITTITITSSVERPNYDQQSSVSQLSGSTMPRSKSDVPMANDTEQCKTMPKCSSSSHSHAPSLMPKPSSASSTPSPPSVARSSVKPTLAAKPTVTTPKPVTRVKPQILAKPQILSKPSPPPSVRVKTKNT